MVEQCRLTTRRSSSRSEHGYSLDPYGPTLIDAGTCPCWQHRTRSTGVHWLNSSCRSFPLPLRCHIDPGVAEAALLIFRLALYNRLPLAQKYLRLTVFLRSEMRHQNCPTSCDAGWRDGLVARRAHSPPFSRSGCAINKKDPVPWRRGPSLKTEGNGLAPTDVSDFEIACLRQSPEIRRRTTPTHFATCRAVLFQNAFLEKRGRRRIAQPAPEGRGVVGFFAARMSSSVTALMPG